MGHRKSSSEREVYSNTISHQEKSPPHPLKKPNLTLKAIRERTNKTQSQQKEKIIKIRAEINEIEMKKTLEKINETKSQFCKMINQTDKALARLNKKKRKKVQINKIRNE